MVVVVFVLFFKPTSNHVLVETTLRVKSCSSAETNKKLCLKEGKCFQIPPAHAEKESRECTGWKEAELIHAALNQGLD